MGKAAIRLAPIIVIIGSNRGVRYSRERKTGQIGNTGKLREEGGIIDNRGNRERHNVFVFGFGGLLRRRLIGS